MSQSDLKCELTGWGNYPSTKATMAFPFDRDALALPDENTTMITRGLGKSYGDSALAEQVLSTEKLDKFIGFDETRGILQCEPGVSLAEILRLCVPKGWFLAVSAGTQYISVGGAIAADVHGKNHQALGCFSEHVLQLDVLVADNQIVRCSRTMAADLFYATCAGMGLTGIILTATLALKKISSAFLNESAYRTKNLTETFDFFEQYSQHDYQAAWVDLLATKKHLGRSRVMYADHLTQGELCVDEKKIIPVPFFMPSSLLNATTNRLFNAFYYYQGRQAKRQSKTHYARFLYPLDSMKDWNRLYGRKGFCQYQFVLPLAASRQGMEAILAKIVRSQRGSFLTVLKRLGRQNKNFLSFPLQGYTLAVDFKWDSRLHSFLNELDAMVLDFGGRVYLAKDANMSEQTFKQSYPGWQAFLKVREAYGCRDFFNSLQSKRLGL